MGKSFAKVKLCHTGDFPPNKNDKIKQWVENNGGTFHPELAKDTTHLLCTVLAWKKYHPMIRDARRCNRTLPPSKKIKIVSFDWLEESLLKPSRKPLNTRKYEFEEQKKLQFEATTAVSQPSVDGAERAKPVEKKASIGDRQLQQFEQDIAEFEQDMETTGYHPYTDSTGFVYVIVLMRPDILRKKTERHRVKVRYSSPCLLHISGHPPCPNPVRQFRFPPPYPFSSYPVLKTNLPRRFIFKASCPNRKLRVPICKPWAHCLQLFESDAEPRRYACYALFSSARPGQPKYPHYLAPVDSDWDFAWNAFTIFFKLKTGIEWNQRPDWTQAGATHGITIDRPDKDMEEVQKYRYEAPKPRQPLKEQQYR